jgi:hypothetical protein
VVSRRHVSIYETLFDTWAYLDAVLGPNYVVAPYVPPELQEKLDMGQFDGKSNEEVAKSGRTDSGYCNPMKVKFADEDRTDAVEELMDRGFSRSEAESMVDDD